MLRVKVILFAFVIALAHTAGSLAQERARIGWAASAATTSRQLSTLRARRWRRWPSASAALHTSTR